MTPSVGVSGNEIPPAKKTMRNRQNVQKTNNEAKHKTKSVLFSDDGCDVNIKAAAAMYQKAKTRENAARKRTENQQR